MTFIVPSSYIDNDEYIMMSTGSKVGLSLMPNVALWWGIMIISIQEGRGSGLQWDTLSDRSQPDDPFTMSVIWGMLAVDMAIFMLITWYVDAVKPGKYGVAKKWYFPFQVRNFNFSTYFYLQPILAI